MWVVDTQSTFIVLLAWQMLTSLSSSTISTSRQLPPHQTPERHNSDLPKHRQRHRDRPVPIDSSDERFRTSDSNSGAARRMLDITRRQQPSAIEIADANDRLPENKDSDFVTKNGHTDVLLLDDEMDFARVPVSTVTCSTAALYGILTVDCSTSGLTSMSAAVGHLQRQVSVGKVGVLRLDDNLLMELEAGSFSDGLTHLKQLNVARNRLYRVDNETFRGLYNLQILDISNNRLPALPIGSFHHLTAVRNLIFRGNPIGFVGPEAFRQMTAVESIDLAECQLTRIDYRAFSGCHRLVAVNLADNLLVELDHQMSFHMSPQIWNKTAAVGYDNYAFQPVYRGLPISDVVRAGVRLDGNPWRCDCKLRWLRRKFPPPDRVAWSSSSSQVGAIDESKWPACAEPLLLRGVAWRHLAPEQFACPSIIVTDDDDDDEEDAEDGVGRRRHQLIEVRRGRNATVRCTVAGDPEPRVQWTRLAPIISRPHHGYVVIADASNAPSTMSDEADDRLSFPHRGETSFRIPEAVTATTTTKLYYRKSNEDANAEPSFGMERRLVSVVHVTAANPTLHDGVYRCTAINPAGRAEVAFTVTVTDEDGDDPTTRSRSPTSTTRRHSERRTVASWALLGRSIAVFGMTLVVLMAALVALIIVRRHRYDARRRVRDAAGSAKHPAAGRGRFRRGKRCGSSRGVGDDRDRGQSQNGGCGDVKGGIVTSLPNDSLAAIDCGGDKRPIAASTAGSPSSVLHFVSKTVAAAKSRTGRQRPAGGVVAIAAWERGALTPIEESPSETDDGPHTQMTSTRSEFRVKIFPIR